MSVETERELIFLRHGAAVTRDAGLTDLRRPLTDKGMQRVRRSARGLRALIGDIDAIWSSPAVRALQTADIAAGVWDDRHTVRIVDELLPGSETGALATMVRREEAGKILLVGHEPLLSATVASLLGCDPMFELRKSGACAVTLTDGVASLRFLMTSSMLRRVRASRNR